MADCSQLPIGEPKSILRCDVPVLEVHIAMDQGMRKDIVTLDGLFSRGPNFRSTREQLARHYGFGKSKSLVAKLREVRCAAHHIGPPIRPTFEGQRLGAKFGTFVEP